MRVSWRYGAVLALGGLFACGLNASGELGVDAGSQGPMDDGGTGTGSDHDARSDAKHPGDATVAYDAKPDAKGGGGESSVDAPMSLDGAHASDAPAAHDGEVPDAVHDSSLPKDVNTDDVGHPDATSQDGGSPDASDHDAAAHTDAGEDAGVDASGPPGGCFLDYSCGSSKCSCNQLCDDGTTCGACIPHYGSCLGTCDTDFSSLLSCGGCGNICTCLNPFNVSCNAGPGGTYTCGC